MSGPDLMTINAFDQVFHLNVAQFTQNEKVWFHHFKDVAIDLIAVQTYNLT